MTNALVLGRRRPGRQIGEAVEETRSRLEAAGWKVDSRLVTKKKALRKHAKRAVKHGLDVVVAVGGDGAVFQVVNMLAESSTALGIVPKGTGNLLATNLDIPKDTRKAVEILIEGEPRTIDLGRVTLDDGQTRDFAVACGVGFDARVMDATEPEQKRTWGRLAYVANAVRESRLIRDVRHEITIDGKAAKASAAQVFVANFGRIGSYVEPRRRVIPDDGRFDVFVVKATGPIDGLVAGWRALRQRHLGESDDGRILRARATDVSVRSMPRQLVEADGSVIGTTPISVSIRPRALKVLAPARH